MSQSNHRDEDDAHVSPTSHLKAFHETTPLITNRNVFSVVQDAVADPTSSHALSINDLQIQQYGSNFLPEPTVQRHHHSPLPHHHHHHHPHFTNGKFRSTSSCSKDGSIRFSVRTEDARSAESSEIIHPEDTLHNDPDLLPAMETMQFHGSTRNLINFLHHNIPNIAESSDDGKNIHNNQDGDESMMCEDTNSIGSNATWTDLWLKTKVASSTHPDQPTRRWHMKSGSLQQSVVVAVVIAFVNGIACYLYYEALQWALRFAWHDLPQRLLNSFHSPESQLQWLWIPLVITFAAFSTGLAVVVLGEPGDMAFTVACVHSPHAYIPINHVMPMVVASFFTVLGAASLGPEAPLVAICGALAGWVSRDLFHERHANVTRKHTLMGMAGALAAFFGVPLGGSLFALEINSRFGLEYYEHVNEAIFCGELTLIVFRTISGEPAGALWDLGVPKITEVEMFTICIGGLLGLVGAGMAYIFALLHSHVMGLFSQANLLDNSRAVWRALAGAVGIILTGILIPQTLFWSESEIQTLVTRSPASELPHVWPTSGIIGYEMDSIWKTALVGLVKLVSISFSIAGGFRGGFIFPLFAAGGTFGRALADWTGIPTQLGILCVAAGLNTAITRTALASTIILTFLSGDGFATPAVLMASLCSLFASGFLVFIKTQIARSDIDHSVFHAPEKKNEEFAHEDGWDEDSFHAASH
jgi:H+/Cl- antiporter ClcA